MKERGMIFNAEMVNAILSGRKTQTRRVMKDQPNLIPPEDEVGRPGYWIPWHAGRMMARNESMAVACPFGQIGDRLWVREAYQGPLVPEEKFEEYEANYDQFETPEYCEYAADGGPRPEYRDRDDNLRYGWKPSIHMPRWASRITLEITGVRVERLNSISEEDAKSEGVGSAVWFAAKGVPEVEWTSLGERGAEQSSHINNFATLWESIYGAESWQANPWVWVIEFKRVDEGATS